LQRDHTMAFLRLVWAFLLPLFPFLGYSSATILQAMLLVYALYFAADIIQIAAAWSICAPSERFLLRDSARYLPFMPLYRMAIFFFRMSGSLKTLTEPPRWTSTDGWMRSFRLPGQNIFSVWVRRIVEYWAG
jgi:poly-beta-1,6-N-acetyl-D-glucosamine synthase